MISTKSVKPAPYARLVEHLLDVWWLAGSFIAGLSLISILQAVYVEFELVASLQRIVDAYADLLKIVGAIFEPPVTAILRALDATFGWHLELQPYWRPLFTLCLVPVLAGYRAVTKQGLDIHTEKPFTPLYIFFHVGLRAIGALITAVCAGLIPTDPAFFFQPVLLFVLIVGAALRDALGTFPTVFRPYNVRYFFTSETVNQRPHVQTARELWIGLPVTSLLAFLPPLAGTSAFFVYAAALAIEAFRIPNHGAFHQDSLRQRMAYVTIGGFLAAGILLISNFMIWLLSS